MAATNMSPEAMLNYLPLTAAVTQVMADLPKPLPDAFYTQTRPVPGDAFRRFLFTPTRRTSLRARRGSPPKRVDQTIIKVQDAKCIHSIEEVEFGSEVYKLFHPYQAYEPVVYGATTEMDRRAADFARRQLNLRTAAIHSVTAAGYVWFDAADEILPTSSGAVETIDFLIPAGNRRTATTDWSVSTNDVVTFLANEMTYMMINSGGFRPEWAICGPNVQGYLSQNTKFIEYLKLNNAYNQSYITQGVIKDGTLNLSWVMAQDAYFERSDGTFPQQFPADQITFFPKLTRDIYELKEGSQPVPKQYTWGQTDGDPVAAFRAMFENPVYGPFRYAVGRTYPIPEVIAIQGDNFLPDLPNPQAVWLLDTKP